MKKYTLVILSGILLLLAPRYAQGQLTVADTLPSIPLLQTLFSNGVQISNITFACDTNVAMWEFDGTNSNLGLTRGVLMSSGEAQDAPGPNNSGGISGSLGRPGYGPLNALTNNQNTFDACVISFDVTPICDSIGIRYVFASEEYNEYVNSINDVFAFFIDGPGIPEPPPGRNIALVPGTAFPVAINTINNGNAGTGIIPTGPCNNCVYFQDNTGGTSVQYDAFTVPLVARAAVTPCQTYRITLAIADASDPILDSGVFLEANGIGCITPLLQLAAVNSTVLGSNIAVEGCVNYGEFTFTLPQALADTVVFRYTIGGSAIAGIDYQPFQDSIVMPAGQTSITVPVFINPDNIAEGSEFIEIYYVDSTLCTGIYRDTAVMEIWDKPQIPLLQDTALCSASPVNIGFPSAPDQIYQWAPAAGLSSDTVSNPLLTLFNPQGTTADTFTYYLNINAFQGFCLYEDSMQVVVHPANFASFTADTVCLGLPTSFTASSVYGNLTAWGWSFGDGQFGTGHPITHTYAQDGPFLATLIAQNQYLCLDTVQLGVLVDSLPVVNFAVNPVCFGAQSVYLNQVRPGTSYVWDFGDASALSTQALPTHLYPAPGFYSVSLVATTAQGCVDSLQQSAQVYRLPEAQFRTDSVCEGGPTSFANLSQPGDGRSLSYLWFYGDGGSSTLASPQHTYPGYGVRTAILSVTDEFGCNDAFSQEVRVFALPLADFAAQDACAETAVQFRDQTQVPDGFPIVSWRWDFGNNLAARDSSPLLTYAQPGLYRVKLEVETFYGCPDTVMRTLRIFPLPSADFSFRPDCALDTLFFQNLSRVANPVFGDSIQTWTWNWGDGSSSGSLPRAGHVYAASGFYDVSLIAQTDKGCLDTAVQQVEVFPLPAPPQLEPDTVCLGASAFLLAGFGENTALLRWFEGLNDSLAFLVGNAYTTGPLITEETYFVEPVSDKGCFGDRYPIRATLHPVGSYELEISNPVVEIPESEVEFRVLGTPALSEYSWSFGDGSGSVEAAPRYRYPAPGKFIVTVDLSDENGCPYQLTGGVEVKQVIAVYIPSGFTPNDDGFNDEFFVRHRLIDISTFVLKVYNRWGQLVFETDNPDFVWNGSNLGGGKVGEGVYMFMMKTLDIHGNPIEQTGTITVLY